MAALGSRANNAQPGCAPCCLGFAPNDSPTPPPTPAGEEVARYGHAARVAAIAAQMHSVGLRVRLAADQAEDEGREPV